MEHFVISEKYRPASIKDCILNNELETKFNDLVELKDIQSMIFNGPVGVGKTSLAVALCKDLKIEWLKINGSNEGRSIDAIRTRVKQFADTLSIAENNALKVVIIDEADNMTSDAQNAMKAFMEETIGLCRFIFTTNHKHKIIEALRDRCDVIDFIYNKEDLAYMSLKFYNRLLFVCEEEKIDITPAGKVALATLIKSKSPHFRSIMNIMHDVIRNARNANKPIDEDILVLINDDDFDKLMEALKGRNSAYIEQFVVKHVNDFHYIIENFYHKGRTWLDGPAYAQAILIIAEYQLWHQTVSNKEINLLAMFIQISNKCFK